MQVFYMDRVDMHQENKTLNSDAVVFFFLFYLWYNGLNKQHALSHSDNGPNCASI